MRVSWSCWSFLDSSVLGVQTNGCVHFKGVSVHYEVGLVNG